MVVDRRGQDIDIAQSSWWEVLPQNQDDPACPLRGASLRGLDSTPMRCDAAKNKPPSLSNVDPKYYIRSMPNSRVVEKM